MDIVRSIPLFFSKQNNKFIVSDSSESLKKITGIKTINPLSSVEFQHTGYVTLSHTLFDQIYQIQAGECIVVDQSGKRIKINRFRYYDFLHKVFDNSDNFDFLSLLEKSITNVFSRLHQTTINKTLVVPLSGGLDSRLIISNLHKIGRKNVLCYYYGRKNCKEENISKAIAERLSYDWVSIEYTKKKWNRCYNGGAFENYFNYAGNGSSLPHIQDFLAVKELRDRSIIPEDSIFIPGHTGDFISGGHIPNMNNNTIQNRDRLVEYIIDYHYKLWIRKSHQFNSNLDRCISNKIMYAIKDHNISTKEDMANIFEYWEWKERQSKFIINSVRVYEFFGYEWRLPLWDLEFLNFWSKVPLEFRENKKLYKRYLLKSNYKNLFHDYNYKNYEQNNLKSLLKNTSLGKYLANIHDRYYSYYYLNYFGMVDFYQLFTKYRYRYNINSILALNYLHMLRKNE